MTRPGPGSERVLRIRIERVVMDADVVMADVGRAALMAALQDAVQRHLRPRDPSAASLGPPAGLGGGSGRIRRPAASGSGRGAADPCSAALDSAGRMVAMAIHGALASPGESATGRPGRS
jgi:hypothetical protein